MNLDVASAGRISFPSEGPGVGVDPPVEPSVLTLNESMLPRPEPLPVLQLQPHSLDTELPPISDPARMPAQDARPRRPLTHDQVQRALHQMNRHDLAEKLSALDIDHATLYRPVEAFYSKINDPRVSSGVSMEDGRNLLATYYGRKYGASIEVHQCDVREFCGEIADLIKTERRKPGDTVRSGHLFGYGHGNACVYIREHGREALLFFDSWPGATSGGTRLVQAMREAHDLRGGPIPVFEHHMALQHANYSCWTQAVKAAVTFTRHGVDDTGKPTEGFLIANLIDELKERCVTNPSPEGVTQIRAIPELAKMAQHPNLLSAHAGDADSQAQLRGSRRSETLLQFVARHTVPGVLHENGRTLQVMDYARRKSDRYAEIVVIEAWNQLFLEEAGPELWTSADQIAFIKLAKAEMAAA